LGGEFCACFDFGDDVAYFMAEALRFPKLGIPELNFYPSISLAKLSAFMAEDGGFELAPANLLRITSSGLCHLVAAFQSFVGGPPQTFNTKKAA